MNKKYKDIIVEFSDIHLCEPYYYLLKSPLEETIKYIKKNQPRFVIIAGDYFDRRVNKDEDIYSKSIGYLIEISKNTKNLIVLNGTLSHDNFTLRILNELKKLQNNIYFFENLSYEVIDGKKFLLIPEEYPTNPKEYYKNIYNYDVDYIVGHGELEGAKLHSGIDNRRLKGWKFNVSKLEETGAIWSMWGHIHLKQDLSDKTFYSGSLGRKNFGEEESKGFTVLSLDSSSREFIETKTSTQMITLKENELEELYKEENFEFNFQKKYNHKNILLRYKGDRDSVLLKKIQVLLDNEIYTTQNLKDKNISLDNFLMYKNIKLKSTREQFQNMIKKDLESRLTKKEKSYLENDKMKKKLSLVLKEIKEEK